MTLIDITDRANRKCFYCGTDKSVKYLCEIEHPSIAQVYVCNMCAIRDFLVKNKPSTVQVIDHRMRINDLEKENG